MRYMPGRKNIGIKLVCLMAWAAMAVAQTAPPPSQQPRHELGPHSAFLGWQGETALFREETDTEAGSPKAAYYAMRRGSNLTVRVPAKTARSLTAKLLPGRILLSDYNPTPGDTTVSFHLDEDPAEVDALGAAIAKWSEEGQGKPHSFPVVHATLLVKFVRNGQEEIVWRQQRQLSASAGEGGYVYDPPRLRFAVMSPEESTLLIELVTGSGSEFVRIPLTK
jgi:hypothetical protein